MGVGGCHCDIVGSCRIEFLMKLGFSIFLCILWANVCFLFLMGGVDIV